MRRGKNPVDIDAGIFDSTYWLLGGACQAEAIIKILWSDILSCGPLDPVWGRPPSLCYVLSLLVQHNIQKSVRTLWQQLVAQRRQTLEDTFKMDLSVKAGESEVKIEEVTPLWEETLLRAWQHYLGLCTLKSWNSWGPIEPNLTRFHSRPELFLLRAWPRAKAFSVSYLWWVCWHHWSIAYLSSQRMNAVFAHWWKGRLEVPTKQAVCNSLFKGLVTGSGLWLRLGRFWALHLALRITSQIWNSASYTASSLELQVVNWHFMKPMTPLKIVAW